VQAVESPFLGEGAPTTRGAPSASTSAPGQKLEGVGQQEGETTQLCFLPLISEMSADGGGTRAAQDKERAREVPGHGHPCQEMLSESEEMVPLGAAQESPHIKTEPEEPQPEGASQGDGAPGTPGWVSLSQGSKEKALFLPGGGEERDGEGRRDALCWVAAVGRGGGSQHGGGGTSSPAMEMPGCLPTCPSEATPAQPQNLLTLFLGQVGGGA